MSGTRRETGHIARRTIASASGHRSARTRTRDNPEETSAARDRAANRILQHAYKWGQVVDKELESNEACGRGSIYAPHDYIRENEKLVYDLQRAVKVIAMMEESMQQAKHPGAGEHRRHGQLDRVAELRRLRQELRELTALQ